MSQHWKWILLGAFIGAIILLRWFDISVFSLSNVSLYAHEIDQFIEAHYFLSVFFFITLFIISTVLCLPITVVLTIAAGYFFGIFLGAFFVLAGIILGSGSIFMITRAGFGDWFKKKYASTFISDVHVKKYGMYYIIIGNLLPGPPMIIFALLGALSTISLMQFLIAISIGTLPGTLLYSWAGSQMRNGYAPRNMIGMISVMLAFFIVVGIGFFVLKQYRKK